jgi:hypothetical protein
MTSFIPMNWIRDRSGSPAATPTRLAHTQEAHPVRRRQHMLHARTQRRRLWGIFHGEQSIMSIRDHAADRARAFAVAAAWPRLRTFHKTCSATDAASWSP